MILKGEQLRKVCTTLPIKDANDWADAFNEILPLYKMDDPDIFHEFIARVAVESGELKVLSENLNYSVDALLKTFGRHRISKEQAEKFGRKQGQKANQKEIANILYGGNFGKTQLGNIQYGDGWDFRGSGLLQLTGRTNFTLFTRYYNNTFNTNYTVQKITELIRTDKKMAIHSACWVFAIAKKLIPLAIADSLKEIIKKINGGLIGQKETEKYYERAKLYIR